MRGFGTGSAVALAALLVQLSSLTAQERPGRQAQLTLSEKAELSQAVRGRDGRVIVGFKPATAERGVSPTGRRLLDARQVTALAEDLGSVGLERILRQFDLIPAVAAVVDAEQLEALLADPRVDYVEPDRLLEPMKAGAAEPPTGAEMAQETPWGIARIGAPEAWATTRGAGVSIGVIDSGIDEDHPDLSPSGGVNLVTGGTTRADWDDASASCGAHGTHVAGTAAALDNDVGVVGVAPEADLYALRVFDPEAEGISGCVALTSSVLAALQWAVDQGLDVVNMSLGSFESSFAELDAVRAAGAQGLLMVAAAGNSAYRFGIGYPASYPEVVAVAASDEEDFRASFSSTGPEVEVTGPGVNVVSTTNDGATGTRQGTSMASPHVAGAMALLRAAAPGLSGAELRSILTSTATDLGRSGFDNETGHGLVGAAAALGAVSGGQLLVSPAPEAVSFWSPPGATPVSTTITLGAVGSAGAVSWSASSGAGWLQVSPASGSLSAGSSATLTLTADPSALAEAVHPSVVTIEGDGGNTPLEVPVRFAVAPRIAQDASMSWSASLPPDADPSDGSPRQRFVLSGTAGDRVDVAVLGGTDPILWLYMPDGRTVLARNDDVPEALLGQQALLYDVTLPETGDYFVEVGRDALYSSNESFFTVKARPAGPILGVTPAGGPVRAQAGGAPETFQMEVGNLSGAGTLSWSASTSTEWLSFTPESGSGVGPAAVVSSGVRYDREMARRRLDARLAEKDGKFEITPDGLFVPSRSATDPHGSGTAPLALVEGTSVTVSADPGALTPGDYFGQILFQTAEGWLDEYQTVGVSFRAYTPGIAFLSFASGGRFSEGGLSTDVPERLFAFSRVGRGSIHSIGSDGVVSGALVTDIRDYPLGATQGPDGAGYVASNHIGDPTVYRVSRDGAVSLFTELPLGSSCGSFSCTSASDVTPAPGGGLFVVDPLGEDSGFWRVSAEGEVEEQFGVPNLNNIWISYSPVDESVYLFGGTPGALRVSLVDGAVDTLAPPASPENPYFEDLAVGRSGRVYGLSAAGVVWAWEPGSTAAPTMLAVMPERWNGSLALLEGEMVVTVPFADAINAPAPFEPDGFRFPVSDGPAVYGEVAAGFDFGDASDALLGESITIPVELETQMTGDGTATLDLTLQWPTGDLELQGFEAGEFGGTSVTDQSASGTLQVTGSQAEPAWGSVAVVNVTFGTDDAAAPGDTLSVMDFQLNALTGTSGTDLSPFFVLGPGAICVDTHGYGDVGRDGSLGSADAIQALRWVAGAQLAEGADPGLADVNRDGEVTVTDPVLILRQLVELPVPESSRIGAYGVGGCR